MQTEMSRRYDVTTPKGRATAGSSRRYRRKRAAFLRRHLLCVHCKRKGRVELAEEIHHKVPMKEAPALSWKISKWEGVCFPRHWRITATQNGCVCGCTEDGIPHIWLQETSPEKTVPQKKGGLTRPLCATNVHHRPAKFFSPFGTGVVLHGMVGGI